MNSDRARIRKTTGRKILELVFAVWAGLLFLFPVFPAHAARNIILMIGDGMGAEQVKAAGIYLNGEPGPLVFESFANQALVSTGSANSDITDSAAAATALSTGRKVSNGVISKSIPGDGENLETLVEHFSGAGKRTGLVTNTFITHATPAAFGAHADNRNQYDDIAAGYLNRTRPDVLFGGGGKGMSPETAKAAGYTVVQDQAAFAVLKTEPGLRVSAQFGRGYMPCVSDENNPYPDLSEMTRKAIQILDNSGGGFFLMVEGGLIDKAAHANDIEEVIAEVIEFCEAVEIAIQWSQDRSDTLILVTADHETGGLRVIENMGRGEIPVVNWSTNHHTAAPVPAYAIGEHAERVRGTLDNTGIHDILILKSSPG